MSLIGVRRHVKPRAGPCRACVSTAIVIHLWYPSNWFLFEEGM